MSRTLTLLHRLVCAMPVAAAASAQAQTPPITRLPSAAPVLQLERRGFISGHDLELGRIDGIVADGNGRIYLLDGQAQEIVVVEPSGKRIRTIGRKGQGPGEFTGLGSLGWRADTLVTLDYRLRRVTLFRQDGSVVGTVPWPAALGRPQRLFSGGTDLFGLAWIAKPSVEVSPGVHKAPPPDLRYFSIAADRSPVPLLTLRDTVHDPIGFDCAAPNGDIAVFGPLFGPAGPFRATLPAGRMAVGDRNRYRIEIVNARSGAIERVLEREHAPLSVRNVDWDSLTREYRDAEKRAGKLKCDINSMRPVWWPVIRTLVSDPLGQLWVESWTRSGFNISVIDAAGRLIGESALPARDPRVTPFVRDNLIYFVTRDADDVQSIAIYGPPR